MTNEFNVIGERKDDELHLLVRDDAGKHYDYSVASEQVSPVEPDARWKIDRNPPVDEAVTETGAGDASLSESGGEPSIA